jgi:hypothetical protein
LSLSSVTGRADPFGIALRLLGLLALLMLIALLALMLVLASNIAGMGSVGDNLTGRARGYIDSAAELLQRAARDVGDRFDPSHPPRNPMAHDTEFVALTRVPVGGVIGRTATRSVTLVEVRQQPTPPGPDAAEYAVLESALLTSRATSILGVSVLRNDERATHFVYKGESFRLGAAYYRVNWVSVGSNEVAVAQYRALDPNAALKFQTD